MGTGIDYKAMRQEAINELRRLNGSKIGGFTIYIDVDEIVAMAPKISCDCMKCYLLKNF